MRICEEEEEEEIMYCGRWSEISTADISDTLLCLRLCHAEKVLSNCMCIIIFSMCICGEEEEI